MGQRICMTAEIKLAAIYEEIKSIVSIGCALKPEMLFASMFTVSILNYYFFFMVLYHLGRK